MKAFTSRPTEVQKELDFELDGQHYTFNPPKTTTQIVAMMQVRGSDTSADLQRAGAMLRWFASGLDRSHEPRKGRGGHLDFVQDCQACQINSRLEDPDDPLELDTVMELIAWLTEQVSGRPTT